MSEASSNMPVELPEEGRPAVSGAPVPWVGLLWPVLYLLLRLAAPFINVPNPVLGNIAATVVFLLLPLLWLRWLSFRRVTPALGILAFLLLALVWSELLFGWPLNWMRAIHVPPANRGGLSWHLTALLVFGLANLALITAAAFLGATLAGIISDPKMLLPVAIVGALVDYWGVYHGTTNAIINAAPKVVAYVSSSIPSLGGGMRGGLHSISFVGFGDWLFLTMFLTVAARYDLRPRLTFWMLLAFLVPAMLIVLMGEVDFLPAVVPMAAAVLLVNWRRLKLTREETFATLYAILMVLTAIGLYTLVARFLGHHAGTPAHK